MKVCTKCKVAKETSEYDRRKKSKDGFAYWCKSCARQNMLNHRAKNYRLYADKWLAWVDKNREKYNEYKRDKYQDPQTKAAHKFRYQGSTYFSSRVHYT
jgi:hypothetical protein